MEPAQLQLIFNVIGITGVSSLGTFCYLLKRENRRLSAVLKTESGVRPQVTPAAPVPQTTPVTVDIRHLAADRRSGWVQGLASSIADREHC